MLKSGFAGAFFLRVFLAGFFFAGEFALRAMTSHPYVSNTANLMPFRYPGKPGLQSRFCGGKSYAKLPYG
jgi:hypothetical protein